MVKCHAGRYRSTNAYPDRPQICSPQTVMPDERGEDHAENTESEVPSKMSVDAKKAMVNRRA